MCTVLREATKQQSTAGKPVYNHHGVCNTVSIDIQICGMLNSTCFVKYFFFAIHPPPPPQSPQNNICVYKIHVIFRNPVGQP